MGPDAMILVFWMLSFKPTFSLSSFTFIKRLFNSSLLSAIRVVSSAYQRLLIMPFVTIWMVISRSIHIVSNDIILFFFLWLSSSPLKALCSFIHKEQVSWSREHHLFKIGHLEWEKISMGKQYYQRCHSPAKLNSSTPFQIIPGIS